MHLCSWGADLPVDESIFDALQYCWIKFSYSQHRSLDPTWQDTVLLKVGYSSSETVKIKVTLEVLFIIVFHSSVVSPRLSDNFSGMFLPWWFQKSSIRRPFRGIAVSGFCTQQPWKHASTVSLKNHRRCAKWEASTNLTLAASKSIFWNAAIYWHKALLYCHLLLGKGTALHYKMCFKLFGVFCDFISLKQPIWHFVNTFSSQAENFVGVLSKGI